LDITGILESLVLRSSQKWVDSFEESDSFEGSGNSAHYSKPVCSDESKTVDSLVEVHDSAYSAGYTSPCSWSHFGARVAQFVAKSKCSPAPRPPNCLVQTRCLSNLDDIAAVWSSVLVRLIQCRAL
jgi:hypothetical protein